MDEPSIPYGGGTITQAELVERNLRIGAEEESEVILGRLVLTELLLLKLFGLLATRLDSDGFLECHAEFLRVLENPSSIPVHDLFSADPIRLGFLRQQRHLLALLNASRSDHSSS